MPYNDSQPRDDKGQWTSGDAGDAIKNAASDNTKEIKKRKQKQLRDHLNLLQERLLEKGLKRGERKLIEKRMENMSGEILSLMD